MTHVDLIEPPRQRRRREVCDPVTHQASVAGRSCPTLSAPVVASWLNAHMTTHVRSCFPRAYSVASSAELMRIVFDVGAHLVVADPTLDGDVGDTLRQLHRDHPSILIAVYAPLTPLVVGELIRLGAAGIEDVIIRGTDDAPARFVELGARCVAAPAVVHAQEMLRERLTRLPAAVHDAVVTLLHAPRRFRSVDDLAAAAFVTRRALYRHLDAVGFESPRLLVLGARVLRAIPLLCDSSHNLRTVAASLGYSKPDRLSDQIVFFTGLRPKALRTHASLTDIVARVVGRL
jgi:AraC-like DNA-binding protein